MRNQTLLILLALSLALISEPAEARRRRVLKNTGNFKGFNPCGWNSCRTGCGGGSCRGRRLISQSPRVHRGGSCRSGAGSCQPQQSPIQQRGPIQRPQSSAQNSADDLDELIEAPSLGESEKEADEKAPGEKLLEAKCASCHGENGIAKDIKDWKTDDWKEALRRILLDAEDDERMPAKPKAPLTPEEQELLKAFLEEKANEEKPVEEKAEEEKIQEPEVAKPEPVKPTLTEEEEALIRKEARDELVDIQDASKWSEKKLGEQFKQLSKEEAADPRNAYKNKEKRLLIREELNRRLASQMRTLPETAKRAWGLSGLMGYPNDEEKPKSPNPDNEFTLGVKTALENPAEFSKTFQQAKERQAEAVLLEALAQERKLPENLSEKRQEALQKMEAQVELAVQQGDLSQMKQSDLGRLREKLDTIYFPGESAAKGLEQLRLVEEELKARQKTSEFISRARERVGEQVERARTALNETLVRGQSQWSRSLASLEETSGQVKAALEDNFVRNIKPISELATQHPLFRPDLGSYYSENKPLAGESPSLDAIRKAPVYVVVANDVGSVFGTRGRTFVGKEAGTILKQVQTNQHYFISFINTQTQRPVLVPVEKVGGQWMTKD